MAKPEIRLKGFEGEWELSLMSELTTSFSYGINAAAIQYDGIHKYLRITDINDSSNEFDQSNLTSPNAEESKLAPFYLKEGDITFARTGASVGKSYIYNPNDGNVIFAGFLIRVILKDRVNPFFVYLNTLTKKYRKHVTLVSQRSGQPGMNPKEFGEFRFYISPNPKEQRAIGDYFKSLNSTLQSTTKKIESLKQMKQACLVSMFPQAGETTPRVRFKGFQGEWKKVLLEDCLTVCKDRNFDERYDRNDVLSVSDDYGIVNQIMLLGRSYAGKSVANYRILKTGDIVYTKSPLKIKPFGIIKVNEGPTGIVSTLYAVYTPKVGVLPQYINYYFEPSYRMNKYIHPLVNKGAKNDMKVSDENVLKGCITIPSDIQEQQQIASFFTSLDKQISLQEKRLEKLKQIKAACLDKMFV